MLGPLRGMGPVFWQGRLKKCSELHVYTCDPATDYCCSVIPCTYCLKLLIYGQELEPYGRADWDKEEQAWTGSIGGTSFVAYWENLYGECEFVVVFGGEEVSRLKCANAGEDGTRCRDSSGSVDLMMGDTLVTLEWTRREMHSLPYRKGDDGCVIHFCDTSECTCKELCVNVTVPTSGAGQFLEGAGTIGLVEDNECDAPVWSGTIPVTFAALSAEIEVYVYIYRDPYTGDCYMTGTAGGYELEPRRLPGGAETFDQTFELYDGTVVKIRCKSCGCEETEYCDFCCLPMRFDIPEYPGGVLRPIPYQLIGCGVDWSGEFTTEPGNEPCASEVAYSAGRTFQTQSFAMYFTDTPFGDICPTTPCNNTFTVVLECTERFSGPGDDQQCDRLWLWVGSLLKQVGDVGEKPPIGNPAWSWRRWRAGTCACDPAGGVAGVYTFDLQVDCSDAEIGYNGACAGKLLNCCPVSCSLTLII